MSWPAPESRMNSATTPLTASSQFIQAGTHSLEPLLPLLFLSPDDDDDLDEESIPGFTHPSMQSPQAPDKGKGRAREPDQLAPPLNSGRASSPVLSGNIGSSASGGASRSGARQTVGGIKVETRYVAQFKYSIMFSVIFRYSGVDTLDEPVLTTIVSSCGCFCFRLFTMLLQARDLLSIYSKLVQVLYPRRATGREVLRCFNSSSYTTLLLK